MLDTDITEQSAKALILNSCIEKGYHSAKVIVSGRRVDSNRHSQTRVVTIALVVPTDNEKLLDYLISKCVENNNLVYFVGSELNLQSDIELDYLYFETKIIAKHT